MAGSPVDIVSKLYPDKRDKIIKWNKKWAKYTRKMVTQWPEKGTFDLTVCSEVEVVIKNYKPEKTNARAQEKRTEAIRILRLFQKEGENFLKNISAVRAKFGMTSPQASKTPIGDTQESGTNTRKSLDNSVHQNVGQFPMVKGTVQINGDVEIDQTEESTVNVNLGDQATHYINCYEQLFPTDDKDTGSEIGMPGLESSIQGTPPPPGRLPLWRGPVGLKSVTPSESRVMAPILVKGAQATYIPWANQDLETLINNLPNLLNGASKFIKLFEQHTVGKLLALGDIKALLVCPKLTRCWR